MGSNPDNQTKEHPQRPASSPSSTHNANLTKIFCVFFLSLKIQMNRKAKYRVLLCFCFFFPLYYHQDGGLGELNELTGKN